MLVFLASMLFVVDRPSYTKLIARTSLLDNTVTAAG
jgi:hypothetical protein